MEQSASREVMAPANNAPGNQEDVPALLGACVSLCPDPGLVTRLDRLSDANWDRLVRRAHRQKLAPILWRQLREVDPPEIVPARVLRTLATAYDAEAQRSKHRRVSLSAVLEALGAAGVPVVVLKGAYLAESVYDDPALRPMNDIDIMVREADLVLAERAILEVGYFADPDVPVNGVDLRMHAMDSHLPPFFRPDGLKLELHWSIEGLASPGGGPVVHRPHPIDIDGIWSRVESVHLAGAEALTLCPEDLLFHLALHAGFHEAFYISLQKVCDVGWTALKFQRRLDWTRVLAAARAGRGEKFIHASFRLARDVHGPVIPPEALACDDWTDDDEHALDALRTFVMRFPEPLSRTWNATRGVIDPWWQRITGVEQRARGRFLN